MPVEVLNDPDCPDLKQVAESNNAPWAEATSSRSSLAAILSSFIAASFFIACAAAALWPYDTAYAPLGWFLRVSAHASFVIVLIQAYRRSQILAGWAHDISESRLTLNRVSNPNNHHPSEVDLTRVEGQLLFYLSQGWQLRDLTQGLFIVLIVGVLMLASADLLDVLRIWNEDASMNMLSFFGLILGLKTAGLFVYHVFYRSMKARCLDMGKVAGVLDRSFSALHHNWSIERDRNLLAYRFLGSPLGQFQNATIDNPALKDLKRAGPTSRRTFQSG